MLNADKENTELIEKVDINSLCLIRLCKCLVHLRSRN